METNIYDKDGNVIGRVIFDLRPLVDLENHVLSPIHVMFDNSKYPSVVGYHLCNPHDLDLDKFEKEDVGK